jgi:hypothetical protein
MQYCRNTEQKMYELQRCGCRQCEREYYNLRDNMMRGDYERQMRYATGIPQSLLVPIINTILPKEIKMEEPKNIAVKLLVDKLKSEQSSLASNESNLKSYEASAKQYREKKNTNLKAIKELATALKKLGHKEA